MKNLKIDENCYLVSKQVNTTKVIEIEHNINHLIVIDVSGSMSYDLPEIRKNLKNKISSLIKSNEDTISIIWFSGNNDAGILKEGVKVNSLKQLKDLNESIDRFLKPIGMTAFAKPLELANDIIDRLTKEGNTGLYALCFMSDGYNNDVSWGLVISALNILSPKLSSACVVEYGNYADSKRLTEMSEILGGFKINCEGFEDYDVVISDNLNKKVMGGKKISIDIGDHLFNFAFSLSNNELSVYAIENNSILVNENISDVYFFTEKSFINVPFNENDMHAALYAGIYILADRFQYDYVEKLFSVLGDNYHYKQFANAFGKQKLNVFKTAIKDCVADTSKRFPDGVAKIQKVDDNAYCLMNLIGDLGNLDNCLFYPNHPNFKYNRIGRKRVAKGSDLSDKDKQRLSEAKNVEEANKILDELKEKNVEIKFVNSNPDRGYPLTDLVWNEERANLSLRIYIEGEAILPENKFKIDKVASFKYNTFTLVKDGIVNVELLPVSWSEELRTLLVKNNVGFHDMFIDNGDTNETEKYLIIDLSSLPIVNKGMVKAISANELAKQEWELLKLQSDKKVYDYFRKSLFPKTSKSFVELLGHECSDWLKEIGITDYNGFAPKVTEEESTDFYMSVNLATKVKGLSSLPKVEDVISKIRSGSTLKLNEWIMSNAINKYFAQTESEMFNSLSIEQKEGVLRTYLITKSDILNKNKRKVMQSIAETKFSIILSKKWFAEFQSFDENKLSLKLDGQDLEFTFDLNEKEVKI